MMYKTRKQMIDLWSNWNSNRMEDWTP